MCAAQSPCELLEKGYPEKLGKAPLLRNDPQLRDHKSIGNIDV
jgi:hypothetical protein